MFEAMADLVTEWGYPATTIEAVVRRAKVGYATFYKNYADKEECFLALFDAATERTLRGVEDAYRREAGPWPDRVGAGLSAFFAESSAHPNVARACMVEVLTAGPRGVDRLDAALKRLAPLLRAGRELNPRQAELPETLEDTLAGGVLWLVNQRLVGGEAEELRALLPETLEFLLRPYLGEEEAARAAGKLPAVASA
jgi:AcrR family transcriptional regulator